MLKTKDELVDIILRISKTSILRNDDLKEYIAKANNIYNIPQPLVFDLLTGQKKLDTQSEFVLFILLDTVKKELVKEFFTQQEIATYQSMKFQENVIEFPLRFAMLQIAEDQWIGKVSARQLVKLSNVDLIKYNENTQRTMQRIVKGETETFRISLNKKAVSAIQESMRNDSYIPNTITLNMPEDTEYTYSDDQITIKKISHFDILDGYHRYIAISKNYAVDEKFDYDMELRIVSFSEGKAKQFIWQEDQKTKMRKTDSESFDQNSEANKIVQRLNTDSTFILSGKITRNKNIINAADMALVIKTLWFNKKLSLSEATRIGMTVRQSIQKGIEQMVSEDVSLIDKPWNFKYLACTLTCIYSEVPLDMLKSTVDRIYSESEDTIVSYKLSRKMLSRIIKLI